MKGGILYKGCRYGWQK